MNSTAAGWVFAGTGYTPTLTSGTAGADGNAAGDGWLRLTTTGGNQATSAYYDTAFTSAGASVYAKFDFESYGGNGADGITFFLFDGAVPFSVGANGGSIGYAQKTGVNGLAGGYLGVAIDEFGNFSSASEGRVGGFNGTTGLVPDSIAVRGPGSGTNGYAYLGGTGTLAQSIDSATRPTQTNTVQLLITATNQLTVTLQQGGTAPQTVLQMDLSGYARPDTLKFGFSSGTGGQNNFHDVRNLNVTTLTANLWSGGGTDGLWATNNNWNPTVVPTVGADILFDNTYANAAQTINTGANRGIRSMSFDAPFDYTLNNNTLTFANQGVAGFSGISVTQTHGTATNTINSAIALSNDINVRNNATGVLNLTGALATNGHTLTIDGTGPATNLTGVVSGNGALIKNDSGTATLSGANTYSGGTTLNNGTLNANHATALGSAGVTLAGGTLASTNGSTVANTLALTGSAGLANITTSGTLTQTGSQTLTLANAIQSGAVNLSSTNTGQTLTVQVDGGTSAVNGVIANGGTGAGSLTKTGTGTLTLGGANTYTGTTTITGGTVQLGASDRLADASAVSIGSSGALNLAGFSEKIGTLTASDGATLNFGAASGANTFVFGTYVPPASGVLVVNNWESGLDKLATTVASQTVSTIYISGYGVAQEAATTSAMGGSYGSAYLLTPIAVTEKEWDGSSNNTWNTSNDNNWTSPGEPTTSQVALFDDLGIARSNPNLTADDTIAGIRFGSGASVSYNITSNAGRILTLAGTVPYIQQQSANNQTVAIANLALANNTVADITGAGNLTISSVITGTRSLIKDGTGAGELILTGNNTFSGGLFVNNGIVQAGHTNALGTGAATIAGGATLELTGGISPANAISVSGAGVGGNGAIRNVGGTNTLSGTITENGATTIAADTGTTLNLTGNLTGANTATTFAGAGNIAVARLSTGTGDVTLNGTGTVTYNGAATANTTTGLTTVNGGTLVLAKNAGVNALAGNLTVNAGAVQLNASNQIIDTATVTLNGTGTLNVNGQTETLGQLTSTSGTATVALGAGSLTLNGPNNTNSNYAGSLTGAAGSSLNVTGTGKVYLSGSGSGFSGTTNVTSGTLNVSGSNTVLGSGAVNVSSAGNLQLQGGISLANAVAINGTGTSGNGAIENFAGNNTLSGAITLGGASRVQSDAGTLTLSGNVALGANALTVGGLGNTTQTGVIAGTGSLTKDSAGTLLLSGANTYTGATTISAGTLQLGANERIANASAVTVAGGATFDVAGQTETIGSIAGAGHIMIGTGQLIAGGNNASTTFSGDLTGTGSFTKAGTGTLTVASALDFDGNLNLTAGALQFNVDQAFTGTTTISGGTLRLTDADLSLASLNITGDSTIDFAGTTSSLNVTNFTISGGVTLTILNWQNAADYFFADNWTGAVVNTTGSAPMNQVVFSGINNGSSTKWQGYDEQITPVPEPSTYGALLMGVGLAGFGLRRWRQQKTAKA
jgi:fibronectin-binding autotransporter adhesin